MDNNKTTMTGVKKRQQIQSANKVVFIWVAIAGVVITVAIVLTQFIVKQMLYNAKVIDIQTTTNQTLVKNKAAYTDLITEVNKLLADKRLNELRINKEPNGDNALQVVIDAMPTEDDRLSLAASLQLAMLNKSGVKIEQLTFNDSGMATVDGVVSPDAAPEGTVVEIPFSFKVVGTYDQLKVMFNDLHLSIRPMTMTAIKLSGASSNMTAEVQAKAYYANPKTTDLRQETPKP